MEPKFPSHLKLATLDDSQSNRNFMVWRFIKLMSEALNFTYELVKSKDGYLGHRLPDGNVSGIFGMIEREECDMSMDIFAVTEARREAADFSFPYLFTDITFMTHKPKAAAKSFAIFHPFSIVVWIALTVAMVVVAALLYAVLTKKTHYYIVFLTLFGSLMQEPIIYKLKKPSSKLLMCSWLLGAFFVVVSYQAMLLSSLTIPTFVGIRNIDELTGAVSEDSVECMTRKGSFLTNYFLNSSDKSVRDIGKCLQVNSDKAMDVEEFLDSYMTRAVYITARLLVRPLEVKYFLPEDSFFPVIGAVAMPKTFCCRKRLNKVIKRINEAHLFEKIVEDVVYESSYRKHSEVKESDYNRQITMQDVLGAFIILAAGNTIGVFALIYELVLAKREKLRLKIYGLGSINKNNAK